MGRKGVASFTAQEVQQIVNLLSNANITIQEIAQLMGCNRSTAVAINRKFKVRNYRGLGSVSRGSIRYPRHSRWRNWPSP